MRERESIDGKILKAGLNLLDKYGTLANSQEFGGCHKLIVHTCCFVSHLPVTVVSYNLFNPPLPPPPPPVVPAFRV